jgi:hypothetical protein
MHTPLLHRRHYLPDSGIDNPREAVEIRFTRLRGAEGVFDLFKTEIRCLFCEQTRAFNTDRLLKRC